VCVTGRSTVTMKAALVVLLVAMAVSAVAGRECDLLARLNVKSQWMRAYSSGHDREHFAEAIWRAYVLAHYSAADRERSIVMTVCVCVLVCLSAVMRNCTSNLHQIFCACYLWPRLGTLLAA